MSKKWGCDFFAFSGHKLYGPTGIGVLYGNRQLLDAMPPYQGGGDMISSVTFEKTTWNELPYKFEAGTPHIEGAIGLGAAVDYIRSFNFVDIIRHEEEIFQYANKRISAIKNLRIIGNARSKTASIAFLINGLSAQDVGIRLDMQGIAVRTGHHCTQPVMDRFGIPGTARVSFAMYTSKSDIDAFADELEKIAAYAAGHHAVAMEQREHAPEQLTYPGKSGDSPKTVADEMLDTFQFLEDWPQRYQYLIELGEKTPSCHRSLKLKPTACTAAKAQSTSPSDKSRTRTKRSNFRRLRRRHRPRSGGHAPATLLRPKRQTNSRF